MGSPIQWDSTIKNWYIGISTNAGSPDFISHLEDFIFTPNLYLKRIIDTRSDADRSYRIRYVVPKAAVNPSVPTTGFIFQKSSSPLNESYTKNNSYELEPGKELVSVRNKNAIIDSWYSAGSATIVTKNPHKLQVGNKISIYNQIPQIF